LSKPTIYGGIGTLRRALLVWFRYCARRFPWRQTRNPYAIWVAEVMLQQTQIATVVPYYRRFLQTFPTVADLARAPLERVLGLWSGMGYYRRARDLHHAARALVRDYGGRIPRNYQQARSLPGVGDYTARALLSMAYNQPYAVLDGNVARVLARLKAWKGNLHQQWFRNAMQTELERMLSHRHPGDFNQAIMELGQTVCLPRTPRCPACPLRKWCRGYRIGRPEAYPLPRPRRGAEPRYLAAAMIRRGCKVAMVRGLDEGLLDDLWNFPSAFGSSHTQAARRLRGRLGALFSGPVSIGQPLAELNHGITYRSIRVRAFAADFSGKSTGDALCWVPLDRLAESATSQLARKIAAKVLGTAL
jgi:A/G-specific adenine glycosylase